MNKTLHRHLDSLWLELNRVSANTNQLMAHVHSARRLIRAANPLLYAQGLSPALDTLSTELDKLFSKADHISAHSAQARCALNDVKTQLTKDEKNASLKP